MTTPAEALYVEMDGRPATEADLRVPAFAGYGHFTAFQVRKRRVRGLARHLERLDAANRELFGLPLEGERVRALVGHALDGAGAVDAAVRVHGYLPPGRSGTAVMVTVAGPARMPSAPRGLMSVPYARTAAELKRPGDFGQMYHLARARRAGFDEALLTAPGGVVTEGAVTSIGFWDGTSVVLPDAPALTGVTMALLEDRPAAGRPFVRRTVTLDGLGAYRAAFVTNSQGIAPVHRIDGTVFEVDEALMEDLAAAYGAAPASTV
ncbi:class IV aminotransferase [Streptomyces nitrosporeus]|uniref:Class IV aminotransferase n=1 Tax=Streptomyces nitrosporeus TaxID=28894 RepID=A0A5J6FP35_9ACTN|nr:aminotransferase class IV [Streptomyces nitrosporeus]QEU76715.1 class IV aminotransferase [Streptomyces nitrosporeus]